MTEIDARWKPTRPGKNRLRIIGSAALMLQSDYERGTKDSDVLETDALSEDTKDQLRRLAGKETDVARRHGVYIDIVQRGLPFLPQAPVCHELSALNACLLHFEVEVLDVVDVVVSKLKRFIARDQADVTAMLERNLVPHEALISRFRSAVEVFWCDARADDLPGYVRNLHRIERDHFGVGGTLIDLPSWIDD